MIKLLTKKENKKGPVMASKASVLMCKIATGEPPGPEGCDYTYTTIPGGK